MDDEAELSAMMIDLVEDKYEEPHWTPASITSLHSPQIRYEALERISSDNRTLKAGKTVELLDRDFLRIESIIRDIPTAEIFLRGHRLRRAKGLNGLLEFKQNEVVMLISVEETDTRSLMAQGLEQIPLAHVERIRELIITNRPFPELSFRNYTHGYISKEDIAKNGRLVCRWKYICSSPTPEDKRCNKNVEKCLTRFQQNEIDSCSAVSGDMLRQRWRGETLKGGASRDMTVEEEWFDKMESVVGHTSETTRANTSRQSSLQSRASSMTVIESGSSAEIISTSTTSLSPTGSRHNSSASLQHQLKTSVSPYLHVRPPGYASQDQRRADRCPTIIDITGDGSPKISLNSLYLGENRDQLSRKRSRSDNETSQPVWQHSSHCYGTNAPAATQRASSPDIIEISARVAAESTSRLYTTKYIGASPSKQPTSLLSAKRLKSSHGGTAMSEPTNLDYSIKDSRHGHPGELWPAGSLVNSQMSASSNPGDWSLSSGTDHKKPEPEPSSQAGAFASLGKRSLGEGTSSKQGLVSAKPRQEPRYTFGDAFCGAGGMSRGAKSAGFYVKWGFDFDLAAINSYRLNFYNTDCIVAWAHQFTGISVGDESKVDVLHLSPPCQVFSWAHTVAGKDDEMNSATFFAVEELVKRTKPRMVTLENTSGLPILHPLWLNKVIQMFTSLGFSVRWKIMNFAEYGLVQARKRLIILASW